jgi:hypothetical protein
VGTDYLHQTAGPPPDAYSRYVGVSGILAQPVGNGSGFPVDHRLSSFPTMGEDILAGFEPRTTQIASDVVPPARFDKGAGRPRDNSSLGQQS